MHLLQEASSVLHLQQLLIVALLVGAFDALVAELRGEQIPSGTQVVDGALEARSNPPPVPRYQVTNLGGVPLIILSDSPPITNSEPGLRLPLSVGERPGKSAGAKCLHGFAYMAHDLSPPALEQTNLVDIDSSADGTRIVVMVLDNGPLYSSTNGGMSWETFSTPGSYKFPLTAGNGLGFLAEATICPSAGVQANTNQPNRSWYVVGRAADGSSMMINDDPSSPAPALTIAHSPEGMVVSWPAVFSGFVLQANSNLATTNWVDVTDSVLRVGEQNQVTMAPELEHSFYRLRHR
jgi:hypothetical protein